MIQGSKTLHYLRKSQLLALPSVANHFLETATSLLTFAVTCQGSSPPPSADTSAALTGELSQCMPLLVTVAVHFQQFLTFCWYLCCCDRYKLSQHGLCLVTSAVTGQSSSPAVAECSVACESCCDFC